MAILLISVLASKKRVILNNTINHLYTNIMDNRGKLCEILNNIVSVCLKPALIVLALSVCDNSIEDKVLDKLWDLADIEKGWDVTIFIAGISAIVFYTGWKQYKCLPDKKHISYYLLAWGLYFFYIDKWDYIETHYWLDCWLSLLLAYLVGAILHWGAIVIKRIVIKVLRKADSTNFVEWSVPAMVMLEDAPVDNVNADEFRYDGYAQRIARTIIERQSISSYSLGITGEWGSGKTSMLNLIKRYLEKEDSVVIIDFTPRESANVDCIQKDFLSVVCNKLKEYHTGVQHAMVHYMKALRVLVDKTIWSKVIDATRLADAEISRKSVEDVISQINKKIVVFIDDFDRLTGEEILEVLKVIDRNGSFKHTVFISAYDKTYVNGVLRKYLGDNTTRDFTDKYFNLEVRLPDRKQFHKNGFIQRRLHALVDNGVIRNHTKNQVDEALSSIVGFMDVYLPTARDIKRYIGLTMASYVEVQDDVALRDYLLANLIKYKYPNEYNALYKHWYFMVNPFGLSGDTNYLIKQEKDMQGVRSYPVIRLLFPSSANEELTDNKFGYKHLSWKRSFDYYFFDQELGHIPSRQLIPLTNPEITLADFKQRSSTWTSKELRQDVSDFVISRSEMVHSAEDFKNYLRLLVMARYYCPSHDLYLQCGRLMAKRLLEDNLRKYNVTEKAYTDIIDKFISEGGEWVLSAILMQDALHLCLKPGDEVEIIFTHSYLQKVASDRLSHVLKTFKAQRATSGDVYEMLKANVADVEESNKVISKDALDKVRKDMIINAKMYFRDIVWHKPIQGSKTGILIGFNDKMPLVALFKSNGEFVSFLQEVDKADESMTSATSALLEIYERMVLNQFKPIRVDTKQSNQNIGQCNFRKYNLIFEGEL